MSYRNFRNQALALCLTAGLTASAGVFSPQAKSGKNPAFPYLPKAENVYLPKAIDQNGAMIPDLENTADYYVTSNTLGSVITPSGEEWFYILDLEGTRLNPGNPYFVDMDFTGFHIKVYDAEMNLKGQAKGTINRPEGTLKCRSVEVCMQLTRSFFNLSSSDYEVMLIFSFNPDKDANGKVRYGAKDTTQVYSLTDEIPADGSKLLFEAPGYYTYAMNMGTPENENYIMVFIEDTSWDGEDVAHTHFTVYKKAGYGTPASVMQRFTIEKLYSMGDGNNDGIPFALTHKGNDIYVTTALYEKTFLKDPTAADPEQNPNNNFLITLYKANGDKFEIQNTTKIKMEEPAEGYYFRSYALCNFMGSDDITFDFGDGNTPNYILTVVDSDNTDNTTADYVMYDIEGNKVRTFGEGSDGYVQFDPSGSFGRQFGFYMTASDGNYGIVLLDYPSLEEAGFLPTLFEYDAEAWNVVSVPSRVRTAKGVLYAASVLPSGETGDGAAHYVAWFRPDGSLDHLDSLNLGKDVAKVNAYIHESVLNPYLFHTNKDTEYIAWIYRYMDGTTKTSLELAVVDSKGNVLASRVLPDGHTYEQAYVSNSTTSPCIVINYRDAATGSDENSNIMEFIRLPLNDFEGEGTAASPYIVKTFGDFNRIRFNLTSHFRIANSIDCSGQTFYPIEGEFTGSIDGGNYDILNLTISSRSNGGAIFNAFGHKPAYDETPVTASLKNINFVNPTIEFGSSTYGTKTLGIVAASMNHASLHNVNIINPTMKCSAANAMLGAVAGYADNVDYVHSFIVGADINAPLATTVGGAFGELRSGNVSKIAFTGKINGKSNVGGIIGKNTVGDLTVSDIHVNAEIKGSTNVGGVAGSWVRERINRVFVEGSISADDYMGGITGSIAVPDPSRKDIEGDDYAIIDNSLVGFESMTAPATAKFVHRIFGYSCIDLGDHMEWIPDPTDPDNKGEYVEVPAAEEEKIGKNYVVTEIDAFGSEDAVSEGIFNDFDITDPEWLGGLGFALADWASEASEATPWVYGNTSWMPELYFEETSGASLHIVEADLSGKVGETIVATLIAENVEFENLQFESSDINVAELADLTPGNDGEVKIHIELKAVGQADIIFSYGAVHRTVVHVTVTDSTPVLNFRNATAEGNEASQLELYLDFDNVTADDITATSSDETVVGINNIARGKREKEAILTVDLKKAGTAEITATAGTAVTKATVTVQKTTGVDNVKVSVLTYNGSMVSAEGCAIEVFDIQGRLVAKGEGCVSTVNLATGVYIVRATDAEGSTSTLKINK